MTYSTTAAIIGYGSILSYSLDSGSTYLALGELMGLDGPNFKVDWVDATNNSSPTNVMERIPSSIDPGTVDATLHYLTATATLLQGSTIRGKNIKWKITLPDTHTFTFPGGIADVSLAIPLKDKVVNKIKIQLSGDVVYA